MKEGRSTLPAAPMRQVRSTILLRGTPHPPESRVEQDAQILANPVAPDFQATVVFVQFFGKVVDDVGKVCRLRHPPKYATAYWKMLWLPLSPST